MRLVLKKKNTSFFSFLIQSIHRSSLLLWTPFFMFFELGFLMVGCFPASKSLGSIRSWEGSILFSSSFPCPFPGLPICHSGAMVLSFLENIKYKKRWLQKIMKNACNTTCSVYTEAFLCACKICFLAHVSNGLSKGDFCIAISNHQ